MTSLSAVLCLALATSAAAQSVTPPFNPLNNVPSLITNAVRRNEVLEAHRANESSGANTKGRNSRLSSLPREGEDAFVRGVNAANISPSNTFVEPTQNLLVDIAEAAALIERKSIKAFKRE